MFVWLPGIVFRLLHQRRILTHDFHYNICSILHEVAPKDCITIDDVVMLSCTVGLFTCPPKSQKMILERLISTRATTTGIYLIDKFTVSFFLSHSYYSIQL
jgi:hypothetical protein